MNRLSPLYLLPFLIVLSGCESEIKDTEGRHFRFDCQKAECTLTELDAKGNEKGTSPYVPRATARILAGCPVEGTGFECRPLVCDSSSVCSRLGGPDFVCEKGLCQAQARDLTPEDKLALCLSGTGEWERTAHQVKRLTLARACTGDCTLPAACRKP